MKKLIALVALLSVFGVAPVVWAEGGEGEDVTEYNFEDDIVTGDLVRPDGEMALARQGGRYRSLHAAQSGLPGAVSGDAVA